jgi:hypothetical protein
MASTFVMPMIADLDPQYAAIGREVSNCILKLLSSHYFQLSRYEQVINILALGLPTNPN